MYAQIGDFVFDKIFGVQSFELSKGVRINEVARTAGKPLVQKTGESLDTLSVSFRIHSGFGVDPVSKIQEFADAMNEGKILPVLSGDGIYYGNFLIRDLSRSDEMWNTSGKLISCNVSMAMVEFFDENESVTEKRTAIKKGFATDPLKVIPVRVTTVGTTSEAVVSGSVRSSMSLGAGSVSDIQSAVDSPEKKESLFSSAQKKAVAAKANIDSAIEKIQSANSVANKAPALLDAAEAMADNAELMIQRIAEGDLTNALIQASTFSDSIEGLGSALLPLDLSIVLRQ